MRKRFRHGSSVVLLAGLALTSPAGAVQDAGRAETTDFTVMARGQAVGSQSITVVQNADGWTMSAAGSIGPPFDISTSRFQLRYSPDWQPVSLSLEGVQNNQLLVLNTTFAGGSARSEGFQRGQRLSVTQPVSPRPVVLPAGFYAAYEALAARLGDAATGTVFRLYVPPIGELSATLTRIVAHRLTSPGGSITLREFDLTFANPGAPLDVELWVDTKGRLARLAIPASWFVMIRNDISSVMTREETVRHPGEQELFIPAVTGFEMAATFSAPAGVTGRAPAVVLVGGAGRQDRDERIAGVPIFADLARALSEAGFAVVRYDRRGVGRSGGRTESATLADFADDALSVVEWLRKRRDVDPNRIAMIGYAEGAAATLLAGARQKRVKALGLLSAPGQTGREVALMQQQDALARSNDPESTRQEKLDLQRRIMDAVVKGTGWEGIPPDVRHQADTPWFKSWLLFSPARIMPKIKQPILIMTGALDTEFPPDQADRLESLGHGRKKVPTAGTQKIVLAGVNHALAAGPALDAETTRKAMTGVVAPAALSGITDWLKTALPPAKR